MARFERANILQRALYFVYDASPWFNTEQSETQTLSYFTERKKRLYQHPILTRLPDGMVATPGNINSRKNLNSRVELATLAEIKSLFEAFVIQNILTDPADIKQNASRFIIEPHRFLMELAKHHAIADTLIPSQAHMFIDAMLHVERKYEIDEYE